jgi:hypothetical protein
MPVSDIEYNNQYHNDNDKSELKKIVSEAKQPQSWFSIIYNSITFIYGLTIAKWTNPSYYNICWTVYNNREKILS